jgi:Response regulator containing a CheY-like receiver domain and an HTH DNA-binding domain
MIKDSIVSDKDKWELFQSNFDRIHENFFRRLKEEYPSLTSTDLRLCAMLKVNLSTKEIASMLNLSVRGIESARYRLRKKFNLSEDQSLTDFLLRFR